jgi:hypothetical protein
MNKIVKNALDKAREILKSNTLSETARQLFDEFVAAVDALAEDAAEHNETSIKDEFEKVAAKYATTEEVANMIAKVRESIANDVRKNVSVADKFTPQVKNAIVQAFATSRDKREVMNKLQEIAKENGIELKKRKNDVSGLTYQGMVDYAIQVRQDESDEIYDALYKTPVSKIFFAELDDTNPEEIAKQWSKNPAPNVVKDVQALAAEGKEMTTANVYKMQRIANEDLDDAAEVGQEGALIGTITAELRKAVKAGIVRAILIGDDINPEGKKITKFETIGTKTATDLFTTILNPEVAAQPTIVDLARAAEAVKTERKWLFLSPELDFALREYVYATGGTPMLMSREELAAKIGVDRIFKKDYLAGVDGLHAIILDPDQYWVKEKKETDVAFPQYERNARGFLYELNAGGIIRGLKSTAVLKEA